MLPDKSQQDFVLPLSFWGTKVDVQVQTLLDAQHMRYYFQDYLLPSEGRTPSAIKVELVAPNGPYVAAEPGERALRVKTAKSNDWVLVGENDPSPIPPFTYDGLRTRFRTFHGSCIAPPHRPDRGLVIHGQSTAGKSTLLLHLLDRGWTFVADDTCVVASDGGIVPYTRPIGVRDVASKSIPLVEKARGKGISFATRTGTTRAIHVRDLSLSPSKGPVLWTWTAELVRSPHFTVDQVSPQSWRVSLDVDAHAISAVTALEDLCGLGRDGAS